MLLTFHLVSSYNPLTICISLIALAGVRRCILSIFSSKWLIFAIIIIFLGGIIVIFLYATALSSRNKIVIYSISKTKILILGLRVRLVSQNFSIEFIKITSAARMYNFLSISQLFFLLRYLLVSLFTVVKLVENFKGSLKIEF